MIGIYKITNLVNGKSYIGQSVNIKRRFTSHKNRAFNKNDKQYNCPLYRAFRKYGVDNFTFEVLEECDRSELNKKEIFYIAKYKTHEKFGYNLDDGGSASHYIKLSDELVSEIITRLKTTLDDSELIGEDFGVTGRTIRSINSGECCHRDSEKYPIRPALYSIDQIYNTDDGTILYKQKERVHYCKMCGVKIYAGNNYCKQCWSLLQRKSDRPDPLELARMIKETSIAQVGKKFGVSSSTITKWCKSYDMPYLKNEIISWYNDKMGIVDPPVVLRKKEKVVQEKPVKQIDPNTHEVINIFENENIAARSLRKKKGNHIGEVCKGIHKTAYGFNWEYI